MVVPITNDSETVTMDAISQKTDATVKPYLHFLGVTTFCLCLLIGPKAAFAGGTGICVTPDGRNVPCSFDGHGGGGGGYAPWVDLGVQIGTQLGGRILQDIFSGWTVTGNRTAGAGDANMRGIDLLNQDKIEPAIWAFEEALTLDPSNKHIMANLNLAKTIRAFRQAVAADERSDFDTAVRYYEEAVRLDPDNADLKKLLQLTRSKQLFQRAIDSYDRGDYDETIRHYERALTYDPNNPYLKENLIRARSVEANHRGDLYYQQGDYKSAARHYRQALEHNPENPAALSNLRRIEKESQINRILDSVSGGNSAKTSLGFKGTAEPTFPKGNKSSAPVDISFKESDQPVAVDPHALKGTGAIPEFSIDQIEKVTTFRPVGPEPLDFKVPAKTHALPSLPSSQNTLKIREIPPPASKNGYFNVVTDEVKGGVYKKTPLGWEPITDATTLRAGDLLRTGPKGSLEIVINDSSKVLIGPNESFLYEGGREKTTKEKIIDFLTGKKSPRTGFTGGIRN